MLGAIPYQPNDVTLHTDTSLMPRRRRAWAAWNYHIPSAADGSATVTYDMNALQGFDAPERFLVSLNSDDRIDPARILRRFRYDHPVFEDAGVTAQRSVPEVNGSRRVWYCGAWCGYGFHEDGAASALRVAADFGIDHGGEA